MDPRFSPQSRRNSLYDYHGRVGRETEREERQPSRTMPPKRQRWPPGDNIRGELFGKRNRRKVLGRGEDATEENDEAVDIDDAIEISGDEDEGKDGRATAAAVTAAAAASMASLPASSTAPLPPSAPSSSSSLESRPTMLISPSSPSPASASPSAGQALIVASSFGRKRYLHDYSSPSSFQPSDAYKAQVLERLMVAFCFLSREGLRHHLALSGGRYSSCFFRVCKAVTGWPGFAGGTHCQHMHVRMKGGEGDAKKGGGEEEDSLTITIGEEELLHRRLQCLRAGRVAPTENEIHLLRLPPPLGWKTTLRQKTIRRNYQPPEATDEVLLDEVAYAEDQLRERSETVKKEAERQRRHELAVAEGYTLECQCCFVGFDIEEMVACRDEGHLFCIDCTKRYAEERVFGQGNLGGATGDLVSKGPGAEECIELRCMHGDGCRSGFHPEQLRKALPERVMERYNELQATEEMEKAGVEGLCLCPRCSCAAIVPEGQMIFECPVDGCGFRSCKLCGEPPHNPFRCDEVQTRKEMNGRKRVEEAMTEARVRTCPKPGCGRRFFKEEGCNKVTCSCQTWLCYICRSVVPRDVGYRHFCQIQGCPHTSCGRCPLYSSAAEDDLRAVRRAGEVTAEAVRKESQAAEGGGQRSERWRREVQVNVGDLMRNAVD